MHISLKEILADKIIKQSIMASIALLSLTFVYLFFLYRNLPSYIPIYNQLPWGIDRLGSTVTIFLPPGIASMLFVGNVLFSCSLYRRMPLVARMIGITTFFISLVTFIFIVRVSLLIL